MKQLVILLKSFVIKHNKTTEGIYLELIGTAKDLETHSHHHNKLDSKAIAELTLGDIDYRNTLEVKRAKMLLENECLNLKTTPYINHGNSLRKHNDTCSWTPNNCLCIG